MIMTSTHAVKQAQNVFVGSVSPTTLHLVVRRLMAAYQASVYTVQTKKARTQNQKYSQKETQPIKANQKALESFQRCSTSLLSLSIAVDRVGEQYTDGLVKLAH
jgi:hypothetical protein